MPDTKKAQSEGQEPRSENQKAPTRSLPKGGAAIRSIGEKSAANPATDTDLPAVPIGTTSGRSCFAPQISLEYDSTAGNGPFGLGWNLSLPSITRKTDNRLPRCLDRFQQARGSDVCIPLESVDLAAVHRQDNVQHFKGT